MNKKWHENIPENFLSCLCGSARNESSALPFDLERAKAGDAIQYLDVTGELIDVIGFQYRESDKRFSINVIAPYINYYGVTSKDLRMKYPKKRCNHE